MIMANRASSKRGRLVAVGWVLVASARNEITAQPTVHQTSGSRRIGASNNRSMTALRRRGFGGGGCFHA